MCVGVVLGVVVFVGFLGGFFCGGCFLVCFWFVCFVFWFFFE